MGKINITLPDDFDQKFRAEVSQRLGFKKGNIQIAVKEALDDWITKGKRQKHETKINDSSNKVK